MRPEYMTAIRSAMSATTPRSWVTRTIAAPVSSRSSRMRDADLVEQLHRPLLRLLGGQGLVLLDLLDDLLPDPHHGVQRRHRVLEDHRDLGPAHLPQLVLRRVHELRDRKST